MVDDAERFNHVFMFSDLDHCDTVLTEPRGPEKLITSLWICSPAVTLSEHLPALKPRWWFEKLRMVLWQKISLYSLFITNLSGHLIQVCCHSLQTEGNMQRELLGFLFRISGAKFYCSIQVSNLSTMICTVHLTVILYSNLHLSQNIRGNWLWNKN